MFMFFTAFLVSLLIFPSLARIENDQQLFDQASKRIQEIGGGEFAELLVDEEKIRQPFNERSAQARRNIDAWQDYIRTQEARMNAAFSEMDETAKQCLQSKKDAILQQPHFIFMRMEIEGIEAKIQVVESSEPFQAAVNQAIENHQREFDKAQQAYEKRMEESASNRREGKFWCCWDGCYQQEWVAELSWRNPAKGVRYRFGLSEIDHELEEKKRVYEKLVRQTCESICYSIYGDEFRLLWDEAQAQVDRHHAEVSRLYQAEQDALVGVTQKRRDLREALRPVAIHQVLVENDEANEMSAMLAMVDWVSSLNG